MKQSNRMEPSAIHRFRACVKNHHDPDRFTIRSFWQEPGKFKKAMESKEHIDKLETAGHPVKIMVGEEFVKYYWESVKVAQKWVDYVRKKQ